MEPAANSSSKNMVIGVIVVIVILLIGTYLFTRNPASQTTEVSPSPTEMVSVGGDRLAVGEQFPGGTLYFDSVTFANGGWVVVHESDAGKPGKVIGAKYFPKGSNPGSVDLGNNKMVTGNSYIVMLHSDNGDMKFSETTDPAILDSAGNPIMTTVKASKTPEEVKG